MGGAFEMMTRCLLVVLVGAILVSYAAGAAVELKKDNFDALVFDSGKNAFVKFLAPW